MAIVRGERCSQLERHAWSMQIARLVVEEVVAAPGRGRGKFAGMLVHEIAEGKGIRIEHRWRKPGLVPLAQSSFWILLVVVVSVAFTAVIVMGVSRMVH